MNISKLLVVILFSIIMLFPSSVSAHILDSDGAIGAVLHIDPEDDPIVGQPASFFFEIKDKNGKFKPEDCNCLFLIEEDGKQIFSQSLFQNSNNPSMATASVFYTFAKRDVYKVSVVGDPIRSGDFQPFKLEYDLRVSRESANKPTSSETTNWFSAHMVQLVGGGIVVLFLVFAIITQGRKKGLEK